VETRHEAEIVNFLNVLFKIFTRKKFLPESHDHETFYILALLFISISFNYRSDPLSLLEHKSTLEGHQLGVVSVAVDKNGRGISELSVY
jgi:hypothetical protein